MREFQCVDCEFLIVTQSFCRNIIWVLGFVHLLMPYFDYFLLDGTFGISENGWRFIPLCIVTSQSWALPIAAVFGLEEDTESLEILHAELDKHCRKHGYEGPAFKVKKTSPSQPAAVPSASSAPAVPLQATNTAQRTNDNSGADSAASSASSARDMNDKSADPSIREWAKTNLRLHIYASKWERFLVLMMRDNVTDDILLKLFADIRLMISPTVLHTDGHKCYIKLW